jgi:hypothetical protein
VTKQCAAYQRPAHSEQSLVAIAEGTHAYPSRTRPLRPPAPMILGAKAPGKVGRRQAEEERDSSRDAWVFFVYVECERSTKNRRSGATKVALKSGAIVKRVQSTRGTKQLNI